jgi:hypothetical protein
VSTIETGGPIVDEEVWGEIVTQWRKRDFSKLREQVARLEGVDVEDLGGGGLFGEDPARTLSQTLEAAAVADPVGPVLVALYAYGCCLHHWEKSSEYGPVERALNALSDAADQLRREGGVSDEHAELLSLTVAQAKQLETAMKVENSLQCSCPVQMGHYAGMVVEQTRPLLRRVPEDGPGPWRLLRSDIEIADAYFHALKETGEAVEAFLGPPLQGDLAAAIDVLERTEADEVIAGDVYQSELRAHLASARGLSKAAREPWIQIDEAKLVYVYPFALTHGAAGGEPILTRAREATGWSVGAGKTMIRPTAAVDTPLADIWQHADPPEKVYEGVTVRLPDVSVETKGRLVEDKYEFDPPVFQPEVRLSRLGNHYLRISSELEGADLHELNQALRRGSGSMGEEVIRSAGSDATWNRFVTSENARGYVEDVIEGIADCLDLEVVGDPGGDVHVVVDIRKASKQGDGDESAGLDDDDLRQEIGSTLLFHPIGDFAVSLEEWIRYPPAKQVENLMKGAGRIGDLVARTSDTTILYMATSPDWMCAEFGDMVEFVASIPPLLTAWEKQITSHSRALEDRLEILKQSVSGQGPEADFDLRAIHREEAGLHELRAEVRRELANLHSPRLVWNRTTRTFLDRLWTAAGLPALEDGLDRQLEVISTQQQRLVAIAGGIAEENRQAAEQRQERLGRVLQIGLTVIAATGLAGLFSWINADFSVQDNTAQALEAIFLAGVVIVLGTLIFMSKRSD